MITEPCDTLLLPAEAAELLGLSTHELLKRANSGNIPGVCIGERHWRFSRVRLQAVQEPASAAA